MKKIKLKRLWWVLLIPFCFSLTAIAKTSPELVEKYYSTTVYPVIAQTINSITGVVPFSLTEFLILFLLIGFLFSLYFFIIRMKQNKNSRSHIIAKGFANIAVFLSFTYFSFTLLCGLNYHRMTFTSYSGLVIEKSSKAELYDLCVLLTKEASALRETVSEENGVMRLQQKNKYDAAKVANSAFSKVAEQYPILQGDYTTPKPVLFSRWMSHTDITGMFFPFTMEANINVDIPDFSIPVTMCHELTHLRGFMREDEANFIGYLACITSDNTDFQYSGTMLALIYATNQLYSIDQELYNQVTEQYSDGMYRDLADQRAYWKQFENPVSDVISTVSNTVNDRYLKANNQEDGVKSYGRMVDLLLAYWIK